MGKGRCQPSAYIQGHHLRIFFFLWSSLTADMHMQLPDQYPGYVVRDLYCLPAFTYCLSVSSVSPHSLLSISIATGNLSLAISPPLVPYVHFISFFLPSPRRRPPHIPIIHPSITPPPHPPPLPPPTHPFDHPAPVH